MDKWNPMQDDYLDPNFNSYDRGPGALLPSDHLPPFKMRTIQGRPKSSVTLYVTGIPIGLEEEGLRNIFSKFGNVMRVFKGLPKSQRSDSCCFGFVSYSTLQEAESALRELNDKPPYGLHIQFALSPEEKAERDRNKQQENKQHHETYRNNSAELDKNNTYHSGCERPVSSLDKAVLPLPETYRQPESFVDLRGTQVSNLTVTAGSSGRLVSCESNSRGQTPADFHPQSVTIIHDYCHENHSPVITKELYDYRCEPNSNVDRTQVVHYYGSGDKLKRFVRKQHDNTIFGTCITKQSSNSFNRSGLNHCSSCHSQCAECFQECHSRMHYSQHINNHRCAIPLSNSSSSQETGIQVNLYSEGNKFPNSRSIDAYSQTTENIEGKGLRNDLKCIKCSKKQTADTGTQYSDNDYITSKTTEYIKTNQAPQSESTKKIQRNNKPFFSSKTENNKSSCNGGNRKQPVQRNEQFVRRQPRKNSLNDKNTLGENKMKPLSTSPVSSNTNIDVKSIMAVNYQPKFQPADRNDFILKEEDNSKKVIKKKHCDNEDTFCQGEPIAEEKRIVNTSHCQNIVNSQVQNIESCVEVVVCSWLHPNELWLHNMQDQNLLKEVTEKLSTLNGKIKALQCPSVGDMCAAVFSEDGAWYRARINKINADETCEIIYVDFGNKETVLLTQLIHLPANLLLIKPLAIACQLAGIQPLKGCASWSSEALEVYGELIKNKVLKARKVHVGKNKVDVDLINEEGNSIAELMVTMGQAEWIGSEIENKCSQPVVKECAEILEMSAESSISQNLTQEETVLNKSPPQRDEVNSSLRTLTTSITSIPSIIDKLDLEQSIQLTVIVKEEHGFWALVAITDVITAIYEIEEYFSHEENQISHYRPKVGEYVAAFSPLLQNWYRAYVLHLEESDCVVLYADYGNRERVSKTCPLKSDHITAISPVLYCTSNHLPQVEVGHNLNGIVKCVNNGTVVLEINNTENNFVWQLTGQPWNHDLPCLSVPTNLDTAIPKLDSDCLVTEHCIEENIGGRIMRSSLKEYSFVSGDYFRVVIVWAKSSGELYVQKCSDHEDLSTLTSDLNELSQTHSKLSYVPLKGEIVCAKFSLDNIWYRAYVSDILGPNNFAVHFVDYGNKEEVTSENIRPLSYDAASYPIFGICVSLDGVPFDKEIPSDLIDNSWWSLEIVNTEINPVAVILKSQHGITLNSFLMKNESSVPLNFCDPLKHNESITNFAQPFPEIAKKINFEDMPTVELPISKSVEVIIKNMLSPSVIFCTPHNQTAIRAMSKMNEEMDEFCCNLSEQNLRPSIGEVCLIKLEDNHWYRALAIDDDPVQNFLAVDSGIAAPVSSNNIRNMADCFTKLPVQTVTCSLTETVAEKLTEDIFAELVTTLNHQTLLEITVIEKTELGPYIIDIPLVNEFLKTLT